MNISLPVSFQRIRVPRMFFFGTIMMAALVAFELFNYSTTVFALTDVLGDLQIFGIPWSTVLAIAFCGIDFAGIARLFSPLMHSEKRVDSWYLFGAWILAASMNAILTWWGVTLAVLNHETMGNDILDQSTLITVVPIFVAVMIWLIRVLIIGSFSSSSEKWFSQNPSPDYAVNTNLNHAAVSQNGGIHTQATTSKRSQSRPRYTQNVHTNPSLVESDGIVYHTNTIRRNGAYQAQNVV